MGSPKYLKSSPDGGDFFNYTLGKFCKVHSLSLIPVDAVQPGEGRQLRTNPRDEGLHRICPQISKDIFRDVDPGDALTPQSTSGSALPHIEAAQDANSDGGGNCGPKKLAVLILPTC